MNLETENRFVPLTKEKKDRSSYELQKRENLLYLHTYFMGKFKN